MREKDQIEIGEMISEETAVKLSDEFSNLAFESEERYREMIDRIEELEGEKKAVEVDNQVRG